ncbi:hypothetical protein BaRGS_00018355, partial [Batillaria attramentaria]
CMGTRRWRGRQVVWHYAVALSGDVKHSHLLRMQLNNASDSIIPSCHFGLLFHINATFLAAAGFGMVSACSQPGKTHRLT